jgi:hypothetical protein
MPFHCAGNVKPAQTFMTIGIGECNEKIVLYYNLDRTVIAATYCEDNF